MKRPATTVPTVKSPRAKSHKPVKADNAIGVPATGSAPIVSQNVAIAVDAVQEPDSVNVSAVVVDDNNQTEDQNMETSTDNQINNQTEVQTSADTDPQETIARLTAELAVARTELAKVRKTIDDTPPALTALDVLTSLFKGDKSVHATALTALVKLAHTKDATGASYPEVTREDVGKVVTVGVWRAVARISKGQCDVDSASFKVGTEIANKAYTAAKAGKDDSKAQKKAAGLLDVASCLPDLLIGLTRQHDANRMTGKQKLPHGIKEARGGIMADQRFDAIEDAEKAAPVLVKIKEAGAMA